MPRIKRDTRKHAIGVGALVAAPLSACSNAPSINVLGAYFPDWLFCIVASVVLVIVVHAVLVRLKIGEALGPAAVIYPTLVSFFALALWLLVFQS
ncbi:YtcA family lipoprotein [Caballeronia sp. INDeC2]|uniref:YtcA family lipoprotein n=1 Tax=Caballeronia sp. INDeC2 TaxID=2921747 RepID=UPI002028BB70|nr:YtcA family lipoprotein [Caballeronia sp. INDeC2]